MKVWGRRRGNRRADHCGGLSAYRSDSLDSPDSACGRLGGAGPNRMKNSAGGIFPLPPLGNASNCLRGGGNGPARVG